MGSDGIAIGFLASVSARATPHLSPVCPIFWGADLYVSAGAHTPKAGDLRAPGRYVLHAFLAADGILETLLSVSAGLVVYPAVIARHLRDELPFMATENVLMAMVRKGADRQVVHEAIRKHSVDAARRVKEDGADNDLIDRLRADATFAPVHSDLDALLDPRAFVGRAPEQVRRFLADDVAPALSRWEGRLAKGGGLRV